MLTASEIMTRDVVTIRPEATIQEAVHLLLEQEISGLPVTDDAGRLVGIVTEFALMAFAYDEKVRKDPVSQHMTTELISVAPGDTISKVADLCIVHRVRRLPVVEGDQLVGVIARRDVLRGIFTFSEPALSSAAATGRATRQVPLR